MVLAASVVHVVLMLPRGLSYIMVLSVDSSMQEDYFKYNIHVDDTHLAIDMVSWWLQYLNHSINFFVYVLAVKRFRFNS